MLKKYGVTTDDIQAGQVSCNLDKEGSTATSGKVGRNSYSSKQIDFIYRAALGSEIVQFGGQILGNFKFEPINEQEPNSLVQDSPTITSSLRKSSAHYEKHVIQKFEQPVRTYLDKRFVKGLTGDKRHCDSQIWYSPVPFGAPVPFRLLYEFRRPHYRLSLASHKS